MARKIPLGTPPLRVGLLHSLTGPMALSEGPLLDVERMALDQVNDEGGVLGRRVEALVADGESRPEAFARRAQALLEGGACSLFGCWTSASRKAVKPVVEAAGGLLWYPVQYEGLEESPSIVYTGACLNQQVVPALSWALREVGPRIYLAGSDYVFPRTANTLIRGRVQQAGGEARIVGERYLPLESPDPAAMVQEIRDARPDLVFNTTNGDGNVALFRALEAAGLSAGRLPVLSVSLSEVEAAAIGPSLAGHYACWNWFQTLGTAANRAFLERLRARLGPGRPCSASMVQAWCQVHLWRAAVERAGSPDPAAVRARLEGTSFEGPGGRLVVRRNHHLDLPAHVGRARPDGQFDVVWSSPGPLRPLPWLGEEDREPDEASPMVRRALEAFPEALHLTSELDRRVAERTAELQRSHEVVSRQAREILEVGTPVLSAWRGVALVPLVGTLDSARAALLVDRLLAHLERTGDRVAVVDITAVPVIDTHTAQHLLETFRAVGLMGGRVVLTGIRPAIAQTLVHLGVDLGGLDTRASLAAGLRRAMDLAAPGGLAPL